MKKSLKPFPIEQLSPHLFWDIDINLLTVDAHFQFITNRILQYGLIQDWRLLHHYFGIHKITEAAKKIRDLDLKSMYFLANLSGSKPQEFICYTSKQSIPKPWNF